MVPPIQGTQTWANFGRWWGPGRPGLLQSMGSQRVEHNLVTEQQQYISLSLTEKYRFTCCLTYLPSTFKKRKRKKVQSFSHVQLFATPWTVAYQALPSMEFSRQEYWSGLPFPSPVHESEKWKWSRSVVSDSSNPMDCSLPGSSIHGIFQARVLEWGAIAFSVS